PTFTATAPGATVVAAEASPTATQPPVVIAAAPVTTTAAASTTVVASTTLTTTQPITVSPVVPTPAATATPANTARLTIEQEQINLRLGPGTEYGIAGEATKGASFDIVGKNQQGDWWQVCCVNGQQAWVFGALAKAEQTGAVPVITDLPAKPVAQAPAPPAQEQPTATPEPAAAAPAPPPAADPCAGIGGDGCKFHVSGGPKYAPNGGSELKLQLMFKHSGDGNRPQGSYFVAMFKDGQKLPISDGTRSQVDVRQQGPQGEYNYEYKVGLGDLPGNTVAGNYTIYVLDGNGERDSQDFTLSVPDGQGEIWIEFDQG
ncbi:MAG TPA: SH3 domain-containing protein, partial [Caldilineaceae bacterium]|nr:SH3 domain-containing protein [Caldilineaceae bacterium]